MTPSIRGSMKNEIICENRPLFNSLLLTPSFLKIAYLSLLSLVSDNSLMESIALPVIKKMIPIYTPTNNIMALKPTADECILILLFILKADISFFQRHFFLLYHLHYNLPLNILLSCLHI